MNEALIAKYNTEVASLVHRVLALTVQVEDLTARLARAEAKLAEGAEGADDE